ncbi:MAG TPA: hypothetical protein VHF51_17550 [Solirubrobacteraceae bacterium]|nr:hypothetical protein [Solirubrobacteraceae bacterium]
MSTTPIACTLAPADMPGRLREIAALGREALAAVEHDGPSATLRFARRDGIADRLDAVVAAESRCCAFLTFERTDEPGAHVLRIAAPDDGAFMVDVLVAAFGG